MGHSAVTHSDIYRTSEKFERGGVVQAGVEAKPFQAWIDSWQMRSVERMGGDSIAPVEVKTTGANIDYELRIDADRALVLQIYTGYIRKSEREQASYYYSQPFFKVTGRVTIDDKP